MFPYTGVHGVLVSLMAQRAEVKYDPEYILPSQIANAFKGLGFYATVDEGEGLGQGCIELTVSNKKLLCWSTGLKFAFSFRSLSSWLGPHGTVW